MEFSSVRAVVAGGVVSLGAGMLACAAHNPVSPTSIEIPDGDYHSLMTASIGAGVGSIAITPVHNAVTGTLDMIILRTLLFGPAHGQQIARHIQRTTDDLLQVEHGSLYPALHRLEGKGWIAGKDADDFTVPALPRSSSDGGFQLRQFLFNTCQPCFKLVVVSRHENHYRQNFRRKQYRYPVLCTKCGRLSPLGVNCSGRNVNVSSNPSIARSFSSMRAVR